MYRTRDGPKREFPRILLLRYQVETQEVRYNTCHVNWLPLKALHLVQDRTRKRLNNNVENVCKITIEKLIK